MKPAVFGLGIVFMVIGVILMIVLFPLVMVDTPEEAGQKAKEDEIAQGTPLRFKGKISEVRENVLFIQKPGLIIEGFEGSFGSIPVIVDSISGYAVGDEVVVEGKFYGILSFGYLMGDWDSDTNTADPANVEKVPTWGFFFGLIVFAGGLIVTIYGYREV